MTRFGLVLLAGVAVTGCAAKSAEPPTPAPTREVAKPPIVVPPVVDAAAAIASSPIPAATTQLITTVVDDWSSTTGEMHRWHRAGAAWIDDGGWPVVVGKSGLGWGRGLHGRAAPAGRDGPTKREGDGAAPAGVFALRGTYGYADAPPSGVTLPYAKLTPDIECVDDPASAHYTQILARGSDVDWTSSEHMRRRDDAYTWVVDVAHNPAADRGVGSCIFLHVWRDARSPTVGCTAMAEDKLVALLRALTPDARPLYVLLPRAEYTALHEAWGLPPLDASAKVTP